MTPPKKPALIHIADTDSAASAAPKSLRIQAPTGGDDEGRKLEDGDE